MWSIRGRIDGTWQSLDTRQESGRLPSLEQVRELARQLEGSGPLVRSVDQELERTGDERRVVRSFDAVQHWSSRVVEDANELGLRDRFAVVPDSNGALAYVDEEGIPSTHPSTVAWTAATLVVARLPAGVTDVEIVYEPTDAEAALTQHLTKRFTSATHRLETIFDARSCHGTNTALIDRFIEMRSQGAAFVAEIRANTGLLVGRVLNRITRRQPRPLRDPCYESRLTGMETRWWQLATSCADLRFAAATTRSDIAMVFVHGTLSCALQSLKDLFPTTPQDQLVFRFEHDTFARIGENGRELATLIRDKLPVKRLVLVAHSRGGLVARIAAALLQHEHFGGEVRLLTFGTPHAGTPLVRVSSGLLNLLLKLGSPIVSGVPLMTPILAAFFNVYNFSSLPDGISVMHESSEALQLLNTGGGSDHMECWGSEFDPTSTESGFGIDTENVLTGAMGQVAHDLVVPTASALAWGTKQPPLTCSHDRYFERREVRAAVMAALQPQAAPLPSVAPAPVSDASSPRATGDIPVLKPLRLVRRLMSLSRLPRWFSVPPGFTREQLQVTLDMAPPGGPLTMQLQPRDSSTVLHSMLCEVYEDSTTPEGKTRQILRAATGELEAIQYGPRWTTFRMVEPVPLPASFDPNAPFAGAKGGTS